MKDMKILLPVDESANSTRTVKALIAMKEKIDCPLTLLHVFDLDRISFRGIPEMHFDMIEERAKKGAEKFLAEQRELFAREGMQAETLMKTGSPRKVICALADSGEYDLLVIGRHAEGELRNLIFGQVSNYVIHNVKCPVMVI